MKDLKQPQIPKSMLHSKKWSYFYDKNGELKRVPKKQKTVSKIQKEAESAEYGKQIGAIKAKNKVGFLDRLKELIYRKLEDLDPLKICAIGGLTLFIHGLIINSPELKEKAALYGSSAFLLGAIGVTISAVAQATNLFGESTPELPLTDKWQYWVLAFVLAWLICEHGGEIAGMLIDGGKGIGSLATAILGA